MGDQPADELDALLARVDAGLLGDPHRGLEVDDRAVKALAADLYDGDRRAQLARSLDALVLRVRDLPVAREAALFLVADVDLAWRMLALALLAEELGS